MTEPRRRVSVVVAIAFMASFTAGCEESADGGAPAPSEPTTAAPPDSVRPEGFELVSVTISPAVGSPVDSTMWFAGEPDQWHRGLTDVTDVGDADGMLFSFEQAAEYQFYMWQTPMPLDIVFFDASGTFVGRADMAPCLNEAAQCPRYSPGIPFLTAIEVPDGALDNYDIAEGATITFVELAPSTSTAPT